MTHNPRMKWIALVLTFGIAFVLGILLRRTETGDLDGRIFTLLAIGSLAIFLPLALVWWRSLDELAKEAHKSAWYWGGSTGLGLSVIPIIALTEMTARGAVNLDQLAPEASFLLGLSGGVFIPIFMTLLGYLVAWGLFWWQKR